ncbi:unnamed protein product [Discula destructiva]
MRRIQRIRQPSAVLSQCLHTSSSSAPLCRASAGASRCLASRSRDFSTTPSSTFNASRAWASDKAKTPEASNDAALDYQPAASALETQPLAEVVPTQTASESQPTQAAPESSIPENPFAEITASPQRSPPQSQLQQESEAELTTQVTATNLGLPPSHRTVAPRADDIKSDPNAGYVAATSAAALPIIGGLGTWFADKNQKKKEQDLLKDNWDASQNFVPFAPGVKPVSNAAVLELCVHRAVLEALAVRATGAEELLVESWRADRGWDRALGLGVRVDEGGKAEVLGDVHGAVKWLVGDVGRRETLKSPEEAQEILRKTNSDWKAVSLDDAALKFAVAKRVFQLTGQAIPDAKLLHVTNVSGLLATVITPPPARRVYEAIQRHGELTKLPNVKVHEKRRTPVHKAKEVGRWKVVEKELAKHGLPVLGPDAEGGDKFREKEWYHGPQPAEKDKKKGRRKH